MHGKMQGSGLTEIIPFICISATHLKRPWCWERLKAWGEGDNRGRDGWMASPTQWTWVWASSRRWWRTGSLVCCSPWGHRVGHDWVTEQENQCEPVIFFSLKSVCPSFVHGKDLPIWFLDTIFHFKKSGHWRECVTARKQTLLVLSQKNSGTNLREAHPTSPKESTQKIKNIKLGLKEVEHTASSSSRELKYKIQHLICQPRKMAGYQMTALETDTALWWSRGAGWGWEEIQEGTL